MPMLAFLPWLHLKTPIVEGAFHVFPQGVDDDLPTGVASTFARQTLAKVLGQYRESANIPLRVVSVLQYDGRPLGVDFDETDRAAIFRFGQHLAVSGLSDRRFIGGFLDEYTASGHYQVIIQAFTEPYSGSISLTHRRKDGYSSVMMGQSDLHFVRPGHLVSQGKPNLNIQLLAALQIVHVLPSGIREHVDASITQYLLANSDSPDVSLDAESIATYAALERVSNSKQNLSDIQSKLPAILSLANHSPWAAKLLPELKILDVIERPVLHTWLQQIYSLRGNVAHGKPVHWAPQQWTQQEHLVAGAFVFPLVLKCRLAQYKLYTLVDEDVAWVLGLEKLLGSKPFFEVSPELEQCEEPSGDVLVDPADFRDAYQARMSRWQRQFGEINDALFGMQLARSARCALRNLESLCGGDSKEMGA